MGFLLECDYNRVQSFSRGSYKFYIIHPKCQTLKKDEHGTALVKNFFLRVFSAGLFIRLSVVVPSPLIVMKFYLEALKNTQKSQRNSVNSL